jgi:hypothetical protein
MFESVTKFLEKVDQRAGEIAQQREVLQQQLPAHDEIHPQTLDFNASGHARTGSDGSGRGGVVGSDRGVFAASTSQTVPVRRSLAPVSPVVNPLSTSQVPQSALLPSQQAEVTRLSDAQLQQRDQALLRIQRDYEEMARRAREIATALERKTHEVEEAQAARSVAERELEALRRNRQADEAGSATAREQVDVMQAALADSHQQTDALRQDLDIAIAQRRQWEMQAKQAQEELVDQRKRSAAALTEMERRVAAAASGRSPVDSAASAEGLAASAASGAAERAKAAAADAKIMELAEELTKARATAAEATKAVERAQREAAAAQRAADDAVEQSKVSQAMYTGEVASHQSTRSRLEAALQDAEDEKKLLQKQLLAARNSGAAGGSAAGGPGAGSSGNANNAPGGAGDWERRAKELAELVIEKQAALEARRNEADQWKARCEMSQQRIREMELVSLSASTGIGHRAVNMRTDSSAGGGGKDDEREHAEGMLGEFGRSQFFGNLSRRGKIGMQLTTVAQHVDGLAMHAGRVLRRSSVLRVAIILYVVVLQLWAFFAVSLSAVPQIPDPPH